MTALEIDKLEYALLKAQKAANELKYVDDGGSCNFDTVAIKVNATKKQLAQIEWAIEKIGSKMWRGWAFVYLDLCGQANRRTRMAEAAAKSLQKDGFDACVYYQLD